MKPQCTFSLTFLFVHLCTAPPIETTLDYVVEFAEIEPSTNHTARYHVGMSCNQTCDEKLFNVKCNHETKICECLNDYPVTLEQKNGCVQSVQLGDQCMYGESCVAHDAYSTCVQVRYNAYCRCILGYHEAQTNSKLFCSKDIRGITQNIPALLIAVGGIAVFSAIICFVLKLFVGKSHRSQRPAITTRLLSSSEIAHVARSLHKSDTHTAYSRKGSRGVTVSTTRATAARAAATILVSCHRKLSADTALTKENSYSQDGEDNYPRSFSAKWFKRESDQKLARNRHQLSNQLSTLSLDFSQSEEIPKTNQRSRSCDNEHEISCDGTE